MNSGATTAAAPCFELGVTFDSRSSSVQFNKIKVGEAKSGNEPTAWAEVPTLQSLAAQFGDFHFGWKEKPSAAPVEK